MTCIGIDLGTTNSLVAAFTRDGARLLPNALGEFITPSAVGLDEDGALLVGRAAQKRLVRHPDLTATRFKRAMGTQKEYRLGRRNFTATDLSALVLAALKADAEAALGEPVTDAVISVPAYFNAVQRQATKDAAEIAGLKVRRLINEPTAAALATGVLDREGESLFVVLDLGGGTFDVSILEMFDGVMEVRASSGDAFLGGEDFTETLARQIAADIACDWAAADPRARETLMTLADEIKRKLAAAPRASARVEIGGAAHDVTVTAERFEQITAPLLARLRRPIEKSLYDAGISPGDVDRVILVGGATRMPAVRSLAARVFRKLPERLADPDHAIALGAAVQAGLSDRHADLRDVVMTDVAPFSLGIEVRNQLGDHVIAGAFSALIERNTVLPASRAQHYVAVHARQKAVNLRIYQGEAAMAADNVPLGELSIPLPRGAAVPETIEVRFSYDVSGLLAIDVKVLSTGAAVSHVIERLAGAMSPADKAKRLAELDAIKLSPREAAPNVALLERLKHLHELLLGEDRAAAMALILRFDAAMSTQDLRRIEAERTAIDAIAREIEDGYVR